MGRTLDDDDDDDDDGGGEMIPVATAWSVESLLPTRRLGLDSPEGSEIFISFLGQGVYTLSLFCPVLPLALIKGGPSLCSCLVFWFTVCCSP